MKSYSFANIFTKTLRDNRTSIIWAGIGGGLILAVGASQYAQLIGTGPNREQVAAETAKAFQAFSFLIGDIVRLDTLGGFVTARVMGFIPVLVGMWAAVAAAGVIRGEEQTGALDVLLSTPHGRRSVLAQKVAALGAGLAIITLLMISGLGIGALAANDPLPAGDLFLAGLNVMAIAAFWGGVSLLISQFSITRRTASAITGALIFGTYLLNNIFSTTPGLEWLAWLAGGFHFYSVSKPLVPGYGMQWGAWTALMVATAILVVVAGVIFTRRDIGSVFQLFERAGAQRKAVRGEGAWLLGTVFGKSVRDVLWPTIFWAAGLAAYAALMVSTTNAALEPIRELLKNMQWLGPLVGNRNSAEAYLSFGLFIYFPVLLVVFSITQVISWTEDEEEGRLELPVSEPLPRIQHPLARYVATLLGILVILAATGAALLLSAAAASVSLDSGKVVGALVAVIPVAFVVVAFGLCAATWLKRPGAAVPLTVSIVIIMFFVEILGAILKLPEAALNISVFHLYGRPLTEGVRWGSMLALTLASVIFFAGSLVGFDRRDIAK